MFASAGVSTLSYITCEWWAGLNGPINGSGLQRPNDGRGFRLIIIIYFTDTWLQQKMEQKRLEKRKTKGKDSRSLVL